MKKDGKRKLILTISLIIGVSLFFYFIWKLGSEAVQLISQNINFTYLSLYIIVTLFAFAPLVWRMQMILHAHKKHISFFPLLKQTIAGYTISYVTPAVRTGGEPLRIYMMNKESNIDIKTGSSCVILDKFIEFSGSGIYGVVGLLLLLFIPGINIYLKVLLALSVFFVVGTLMVFYYRTINRKGSFSTIFKLLRIHKTKKGSNFIKVTHEVEHRMAEFFHKDKKAFVLASLFYLLSGFLLIVEIKLLLLSIGINGSLIEIIIFITLWGLANIFPAPGGLGFLEATQSGLFYALRGNASIGLALSLIIRVRSLFVVAIGFLLISEFSGKEVWKKMKKESIKGSI